MSLLKPTYFDSPGNDTEYREFYKYTGGRWLWDEENHLRLWYTEFNVHALQLVAAQAVRSNRCEHISKVTDDQYNKVFRLIMDNDVVVIANLPYLIDGFPAYYSTSSTAATMEFARTILGIPVPKFLAWDANGDNAVGGEYILTEEAKGNSAKLCMGKYGTARSGSRAEVKGLISSAVQRDVLGGFIIGPTARENFWFKERAEMDIDRGQTPIEYSLAVGQREIDWMNQYPNSREIDIDSHCPPTVDILSSKEHLSLLDKYMRIPPLLLPKDPGLVASYLWHPRMHGDNVFLEGNRISGIVGWQHAWAGPLFAEASPPAFVKSQWR